MPTPKKSRRARGDEARQRILDAAEARLREAGPASIRLQDVAADVGISHPAVLHHFGSREGLIDAVVERALGQLQNDLIEAIAAMSGTEPEGLSLLDRVFDVLFERGHARLIGWLLLSGHEPLASPMLQKGWEQIAKLTHARRVAKWGDAEAPSYEDTRFTVVLSALALLGQAIAGEAALSMAGFGEGPRVQRRFRKWLAALLAEHLASQRSALASYSSTSKRT